MHAFISTKPLTLNNGKFVRTYPAGVVGPETPIDKLIIDTAGESKALADYFKKLSEDKQRKDSQPSEPGQVTDGLQVVPESQLVVWAFLPARMGRVSAKLLDDTLHMHDEPEVLSMQCNILKARKSTQKHFRFVVVNAFGTNLGDTLMGMTAMRVAAETLRTHFSSFSVDFLLGPSANSLNKEIVGYEDWVGQAFFESPSLQDFTRYDAYFDFTNLINLPKFSEMPTIDWYLWWMGLDPTQVARAQKRNLINIQWADWQAVHEVLKGHEGPRVLFNPKASVPLRSFLPEQAVKFVRKLLESDSRLNVVIDQEMEITHKRVINLAGKIDSPGKFQALIAQLDGVITVDSFASHVADAASVPTVLLCSTIPAGHFPYYPHMAGLEIPDAQSLPAWKKTKLTEEAEWLKIKDQYAAAWSKVKAKEVSQQLKERIARRAETPNEGRRIRLVDGPPKFAFVVEAEGRRKLRHDEPSAMWSRVHDRLAKIAQVFLKPGMTVMLAAPGQSELPIALARALAPMGELHLHEPRQVRRMLIDSDVLRHSPLMRLNSVPSVPVPKKYKRVKINDIDPFGAVDPGQWGNLRRQLEVPALPVDALNLEACHALFAMTPMPFNLLVEGALETIRKFRTFLVFGPISRDEARKVLTLMADERYQFWAESAAGDSNTEQMLFLGFPEEQKLKLTGFVRLKI